MTNEEIRLVRQTSDVVLGSSGFATRFYDRLFEIAPETRSLFRSDLDDQKIKFMNMIATLIGSLDRPDVFKSVPRRLGWRHSNFGVTAEHYAPTGAALIDALDSELGERFTPEVKAAWLALYQSIAAAMIAASAA